MGISLTGIVKAVTDPGELVKEAVNHVLPKELSIVGDIAGAAVDYETGHPLQALQHAGEAFQDLPQALEAVKRNTTAATTAQAKPTTTKPTAPKADKGVANLEEKLANLQHQLDALRAGLHQQTTHAGTASGWRGNANAHSAHQALPSGWRGQSVHARPETLPSKPAASDAAPTTAATRGAAATSPAASTGNTATSATAGSMNQLMSMSDTDFMSAIRNGKIPANLSQDPAAMLQIQQRINDISQMNQLMTSMMKAMHDMQMAIIQNVRV